MDVVTHAMIGLVLASPVAPTHPEAAAAFMLGSVLPDLDATSRLFGKRAFLQAHQTYTHSTPVIVAIGLAAVAALAVTGVRAPYAPLALVLAMLLHSYMDVTNTYGITLLAPFSHRRSSLDWIFFIDAFVLAVSIPAAGYVGLMWYRGHDVTWPLPMAYATILAIYWLAKALIRGRAGRLAPAGTVALVPSAFLPWEFLGTAEQGAMVRLFRLDGRSGKLTEEGRQEILDNAWSHVLEELPEYRQMRSLSAAYHVVEATAGPDGTEVLCKDLRTRNFGGRFGELRVLVAPDRTVLRADFNV